MKRAISVILAVVSIAVLFSLSGCNNSDREIENLISEFEHACNTLDFNAALNCIDPKVSDNIKLAVSLAGVLADADTDEMFESLATYLTGDDISGTVFSSIKIDVKKVEVEEKSAAVSTILTYQINGNKCIRESTFYCIYYAEKWYISNFEII